MPHWAKIGQQWANNISIGKRLFNMFKYLMVIDYLEDPFTTSETTLLEVAHGGTIVVPSLLILFMTHGWIIHPFPAIENSPVSGPLVVRGLSCNHQHSLILGITHQHCAHRWCEDSAVITSIHQYSAQRANNVRLYQRLVVPWWYHLGTINEHHFG